MPNASVKILIHMKVPVAGSQKNSQQEGDSIERLLHLSKLNYIETLRVQPFNHPC